jgi:hypothetical protein
LPKVFFFENKTTTVVLRLPVVTNIGRLILMYSSL